MSSNVGSSGDSDVAASARVLGCPELLSLVLESFSISDLLEDVQVDSKQRHREHRATLASCARVCRTFFDQALDVLWNTSDNLLLLLLLFPTFRWAQEHYMFVGDLDQGWLRFQHYARRVRTLKYYADATIHPSVWTLLARRNDGSCLLPNLQKLSATNITFAEVAPITLLLAPNMRSVHLAFDEDRRTIWSNSMSGVATAIFDELIKHAGPRLEELCLFPRFPLAPSRVAVLPTCSKLRRLLLSDSDYTILDVSGIRLFKQLSHLRSLSLAISLDDSCTAADLQLGAGFPFLEELWLNGDVSGITKFICAARPTVLRSLEATITRRETDRANIVVCVSEMGALLPRLRSLHMKVKEVAHAPPTALGALARPLYGMKCMKEFECDLGTTHTLHTSDDDLLELAQAWPKLTRLRIAGILPSGVRRESIPPQLSFRGLVDLAQHCPRLKVIELPSLTAAQLPLPESVPVLGRRTTALKLSWIPTRARDPSTNFRVALLLDRLFPTLEKFEMDRDPMAHRVYVFMEAMQAGRKHMQLLQPKSRPAGLTSEEMEDGDEDGEDVNVQDEYDSDDSAN